MAEPAASRGGTGGPDLATPHLDRLVDAGDLLGLLGRRAGDGTAPPGCATRGVTDPVERPAGGGPRPSYRLASLSKPVARPARRRPDGRGRPLPGRPDPPLGPRAGRRPGPARPDGPARRHRAPGRPVTVHDLLTMTSGLGVRSDETPLSRAMGEAGVHPGPVPPRLDDTTFLARLGELPLAFQPGAGWAYHTSTDVLSVLLARAAGRPLDLLLADRLTRAARRPVDVVHVAPPTETRAAAYGTRAVGGAGRAGRPSASRPCSPCRAGSGPPRRTPPASSASSSAPTVSPRMPSAARCRTPSLTDAQLSGRWPFVPAGLLLRPPGVGRDRRRPAGPRAGGRRLERRDGHLGIADPAADRTVVLLTNRGLDGPLGAGVRRRATSGRTSDVRRGRAGSPTVSPPTRRGPVGSRPCCAWASPVGSAREVDRVRPARGARGLRRRRGCRGARGRGARDAGAGRRRRALRPGGGRRRRHPRPAGPRPGRLR